MNLNANMFEKFGVVFTPGQVVFLEYEPGDGFYVIQSGRVKISKVVKENEKMLDILEPGDVFGEMAIIENAPRSATAVAMDHVKALSFNKQNFEMLLQSNPAMALKLLKIFAKRIFDQKRRLMILTLDEDEAKVMDVLLMLAEQKGIDPNSIEPVELNTTEEDIASWAALKPDVCRRVLSHYSKLGKVEVLVDKIFIKNINEIHRFIVSKRKQPKR
ncbi:MAG: Crp/Fnr family transcriptional regulator [Spirochaetes bacterium]|nr:Crp/Fnr family transcriptional regulator [Spirochaetota bacterium]